MKPTLGFEEQVVSNTDASAYRVFLSFLESFQGTKTWPSKPFA